jgi:hypothetical protein
MWATGVKRAWRFAPVTCMVSPGWPGFLRDLPRSCRLRRRAGGVQLERPEPRSGEDERAGRRRTASDHGKRGRVPFVLACAGGSCVFPGVAGGVVSQAPIRRRAGRYGGRHDHVSGDRAAQSDDRARPGGRLMPQGRACPGFGGPPGLGSILVVRLQRWHVASSCQVSRRTAPRRAGGRRGSGACGRSRWWRSSCRGA